MGKATLSRPPNNRGQKAIQLGMKGVLVTCFRNCEAKCTKDIYYLLNRAYDTNPEDCAESIAKEPDNPSKDTSFEDEIRKEVSILKDRKLRPFIAVDPSVQCLVFVKVEDAIDPVSIVEKLMKMVVDREIVSARFCQRILPVQTICSASIEEIRKAVEPLVKEYFHTGDRVTTPCDYAVVYESRLNQTLDRMTVIDMVANLVGPRHRVNLSSPNHVVMLQVFKNFCAIAIASGYTQYKRFNIQELLKTTVPCPSSNRE